ncbi:MAG: AsmA-like C-terminal region-containing protein [Verrucomicrobiae bacterium]|nr:AsmA-like C-terminal region-containing protein [Verrucomicrobiae bacterium]
MRDQVSLAHRMASFFLRWVVILVALAFIGFWLVLLGVRLFGVPQSLQVKLKEEFNKRNLRLDYQKLYLDSRGNFVVRQVDLYSKKDFSVPLLEMSRLRLKVEWFSWWRGESFLNGVEIRGADVAFPLNAKQKILLHDADAKVQLHNQEIQIDSFQADLLNMRIDVEGQLPLASLLKKNDKNLAQPFLMEKLAEVWKQVKNWSGEINSRSPIEIHVKLNPDQVDKAIRYEVVLEGRQVRWHELALAYLHVNLLVDGKGLEMPSFYCKISDGLIRSKASVSWAAQQGWLEINSSANPAFLAAWLPENWRERLKDMTFEELPVTQVRADFSWKEGFHYKLTSDLDWRNIACNGSMIKRLQVPVALEKGRFFVPEAILELDEEKEKINAKLIYEKSASRLEGAIVGKLDPTRLKGFFPTNFLPFFNSCQFSEGADLNLSLQGTAFQAGAWSLVGNLFIQDAIYKGIALRQIETGVATDLRSLDLNRVKLTRKEGVGQAANVHYDFSSKIVTLKEATTQLQVQEMAHVFGGNFEKYCEPYRFEKPPHVEVDGVIDLGGGEKTQLVAQAEGGKMTYPFLGVLVPPDRVRATLLFKGLELTLSNVDCDLHGGRLRGDALFNFEKPQAEFEANIEASDMDFGLVMQNFFQATNVSGAMEGNCRIRGKVDDLTSLRGSGEGKVEEGYLMSIPFLGGLSDVLNSVIPDFGYAKAKQARCTFTIDNGFVRTDDLQVSSLAFSLIGNGNYNFVKDALDMDARINIKGPVGLVLFPVSKLFEYHGTGTLDKPIWKPKILGDDQ